MAEPASTLEAVSLPPTEAIAFLRGKTNTTSQRWTDVWNEAHTQSFMVAGAATKAIVGDFRDAVAKALEQGTSLAEFRQDFDRIVETHGWEFNGTPGWRASIIYETNLSTAYSAGRYAQMTEPDTLRVFPYWQYMHTSSARPRPQHLAWVGTTLPADDPWWSTHYPPNGWRCRCSVRPVSEAGLRRQGKRGPDEAPPVDLRPWRSRDGRVVTEVPHGIDPGFAYNPGKAWQDGQPPPAAPRSPLSPVGGADPVRRPRLPPAEAVTPPPPTAERDFRQWIDQQLGDRRPDGSSRIVGTLSAPVLERLAERGIVPAEDSIVLRSRTVQHLARDTKRAAGRAIAVEDLRRLPEILAKPEAVLRDRQSNTLLFVFSPAHQTKLGKIVVQLGLTLGARDKLGNAVSTAGLVPIEALRNAGQYEVLDGDV